MLYIVGIFISFFLAFLLWHKKNKSEADKILGLWLFFIGVHLALFYNNFIGNYVKFPYLLGLEIPFPLIHAPFLYLYTSSLTHIWDYKKYRPLHFLPFFLSYGLFFSFLYSNLANKIWVYQNKGLGYEIQVKIISTLFSVTSIVYVILSLWLLKKHKINIRNQFSYLDKINLIWLRYLILGIALTCIVQFFYDEYTFVVAVFFVLFIGYYGISQVGIFTNQYNLQYQSKGSTQTNLNDDQPISPNPNTENIKYNKSGLNDDLANQIHLNLTQLMQNEKLFKNAEISLLDVAKKLNIHPNILSQVINTKEQKNFFDYINHYRIKEFKTIASLPNNQKFSLLSLAFDCGFNSKTAFNRNFKNSTGLTPTAYLAQQHIILNSY